MFNPVVVAPTFNNAGTLLDVLRRLDAQNVPVIAVNDGSTDTTAAVLEQWLTLPRSQTAYVETHPKNRGKAAALQTGFKLAQKLGYTHALSIDTDGQLAPEQVPQMLAKSQANPEALVLGTRDVTAADYPARSKLGRRTANLLIFMESGLRVNDSQCGLRVYPLSMPAIFECKAGRYSFETELLARIGWAGGTVVEAPATCTYFSGDRRVSHFRPWVDSFRATWMHFRLIGRKLVPFGLPRKSSAEDGALKWWQRLLRWLSPREAWRQLRQDRPEGEKRTAAAGGLAIGAFIGCLPTYGLHSVIALYIAKRLNLNPLAMLLGTQVAIPPLGIILAMAAVAIGHIVLNGHIPPPEDFAPLWDGWTGFLKLSRWFLLDWMLGSVIVGIITMFVVFFIADALLRRLPVVDPKRIDPLTPQPTP